MRAGLLCYFFRLAFYRDVLGHEVMARSTEMSWVQDVDDNDLELMKAMPKVAQQKVFETGTRYWPAS